LLPVGTPLKRYVVGEKLGQGGFGITYRGFDLKLHMRVAIKEYYPSDFVGRSIDRKTVVLNAREHEELFGYGLKTFLKEARTLAQVKHPHVVRVLNYFEMHGTAYLVMDYLEGEDLTAYLKRQPNGRLPWRSAVHLLLPVLDGLRKVHEAGFMHRDLKPGNLYWTDDGLVLLDFGSARQVTSPHSRSLLIYSAGYAPYEQYLEGNLTRQGPWTDVYGAAATLYFMLTAQRPPSAPDRRDSSRLRQPDLLKPAREWVPDVPEALDAVLSRALAVEPEQRLQSMAEFKQQLEAVLTAEQPSPPKPTPAPQPPPWPHVTPNPLTLPLPALEAPTEPSRPKASPPSTEVPKRSATPKRRTAMMGLVIIGLTTLGGWWLGQKIGVAPKLPDPPAVVTPPVANPAPIAQPAPPPPTPTQPVIEPKIVRIPVGCFQMGSPTSEKNRSDDERQHQVCVDAFEMGQYEVTQAEWQSVMGSNPARFSDCADCPVENVSWNDVQDYLRRLNQRTGRNYRLPTEAEWEYACRGGVKGQRYCGGDDVNRLAWHDGNSDGKTHPVGKKAANGYELYDMSGNVWEWTCSSYDKGYGGAEQKCSNNDTTGPLAVRGGSWNLHPAWVRSAYRIWGAPTGRIGDRGFRLARSL
jgi:formylglycine-generating enzyme required for sulfatase activity